MRCRAYLAHRLGGRQSQTPAMPASQHGQPAMASMDAMSLRLLPAPSAEKKAAATGMGSLIPVPWSKQCLWNLLETYQAVKSGSTQQGTSSATGTVGALLTCGLDDEVVEAALPRQRGHFLRTHAWARDTPHPCSLLAATARGSKRLQSPQASAREAAPGAAPLRHAAEMARAQEARGPGAAPAPGRRAACSRCSHWRGRPGRRAGQRRCAPAAPRRCSPPPCRSPAPPPGPHAPPRVSGRWLGTRLCPYFSQRGR